MKYFFNKAMTMMKAEMVFSITFALSIVTSIIISPKLSYIDFPVLMLLFNLMIVIAAFENVQLLDKIAIGILRKNKNLRMISGILISLCFVFSMFITNDVALITFVPLTMIIAKKAKFDPIKIVILETLAANIGSSFTPMGNPQNLYLFSFFNINILTFFKITILIAVAGMLWLFILNNRVEDSELEFELDKIEVRNKKVTIIYCILFIFILLSVFNVIDYKVAFITTIIVTLIIKRSLFKELDYVLLLTFVCFFISIGNISNMKSINEIMKILLSNNIGVYFSAIFFSQLISNVPCAILLSKFTTSWQVILIGVNVGGMGTIIASLASLISYKIYIKEYDGKKYLSKFTKYNFGSLLVFGALFLVFVFLPI